jgi:hypothetical protein
LYYEAAFSCLRDFAKRSEDQNADNINVSNPEFAILFTGKRIPNRELNQSSLSSPFQLVSFVSAAARPIMPSPRPGHKRSFYPRLVNHIETLRQRPSGLAEALIGQFPDSEAKP